VAIQGFCLRVVDAAEESERMELDCRVAALLAMTGWGGAGGLCGWGGEGRGVGRMDSSGASVIARRRSRRGNPGVLFLVGLMWWTGSQRMELDCRVAALLAMTGWGGAGGLRGWGGEGRGAEHADPGPHGGFAPPRVAESIIGNAALNQGA